VASVSRKRKMSAAEKQRRRERRLARRRARVEARGPEQLQQLDRIRIEQVIAGQHAFDRLLKRSCKVHKQRMKERAA